MHKNMFIKICKITPDEKYMKYVRQEINDLTFHSQLQKWHILAERTNGSVH